VTSETFLESLDPADREALLALGHPRTWTRGELVIRAGDRADSALVLLGGHVKIHKSGPQGTEVVLAVSGPGDLLGEISAIGDAERSADASALDDVSASVLSVPDLRAFLAGHGRATLALLELSLARLHVADARRVEFATSESLARVAGRLVELAERFGEPAAAGTIELRLPINQEELASWSASSKESTARALRTLRELGVIETHRLRMTVLDLPRLHAHAGR
jgi:CRP/FNR family cyclic AMP-dependent transcriptional regulator